MLYGDLRKLRAQGSDSLSLASFETFGTYTTFLSLASVMCRMGIIVVLIRQCCCSV